MENTKEENNSLSDSLINRKKIDGTPFTMVSILGKGNRIVMGDFLMIEDKETEEEALKALEYNFWDVVLRMVISVVTRTIVEAANERDKMTEKEIVEELKKDVK